MQNNVMDFSNAKPLWLIGSGPMAIDYAKVLTFLRHPFMVIGRGERSARNFESVLGLPVQRGGLDRCILEKSIPDKAIIATSIEQLSVCAHKLINMGIKQILLEKPGGLNGAEIRHLFKVAIKTNCEVFLGYNRRFYSSVNQAQRMIREDGGVSSFFFEFTEWSHEIRDLNIAPEVKQNWFLANSSHVADLAFYLGGKPVRLSAHVSGELNWHQAGASFTGSGVTEYGVPFCYLADWAAPGRWGVEILTRSNRYIFRPLEKLQIQRLCTLNAEYKDLEDTIDHQFKPGLFAEVASFLGSGCALCSLNEQVQMLPFYEQIANYSHTLAEL